MLYIAFYHRDGLGGVSKNLQESYKYSNMAADAKDMQAQWEVSKHAKLESKFEDAFKYGELAADQKLEHAVLVLAKLKENK